MKAEDKAELLKNASMQKRDKLVFRENSRCVSSQWIMAWGAFTGLLLSYLFRICMSTAAQKPKENSHLKTMYTEYGWTNTQQGVVLGSFFAGYVMTQIPGALLSQRFGGKWTFGLGILGSAVFTILTPLVSDYYTICIIRACAGLCEGVVWPSMVQLVYVYTPSNQVSSIFAFVQAGAMAGTILSLPLSSFLLTKLGWRWIFFLFAPLGLFWFLIWISILGNPSKGGNPPPKIDFVLFSYIFQFKMSWMSMILGFLISYGSTLMLSNLPSYLSSVQNFSIEDSGFWSVAPFVLGFLSSIWSGWISDVLIEKFHWRRLLVRKLAMLATTVPPAICFVLVSYTNSISLILFQFIIIQGCINLGSAALVILVDFAGEQSGLVFSLYNTTCQISAFLAPPLTGVLTDHYGDKFGYRLSFLLAALCYVLLALVWTIFAQDKRIEYPPS